MKFLFNFLWLFFSIHASAAEDSKKEIEPAPQKEESFWDGVKQTSGQVLKKGKEAAAEVSQNLEKTKDLRAQSHWAILGNYSPIETWVPSKYGISVAYIPSAEATWELEYMRGSIPLKWLLDLGKVTEQRLSLVRRFYSDRNSFNFFAGAEYYSFNAHLGDRLLNLITSGNFPNVDILTIKTIGLLVGLGNRWQFKKGWILGFDWFSLYIPVKTLKAEAPYISSTASESGRKDVQDAMKVLRRFPTFAAVKFQVGISF